LDQKASHRAVCAKQTCACENPEYDDDYKDDSCFLQYDDYNEIVYNRVMFNGKSSLIEDNKQCPYGQINYPLSKG